MITVIDVSSSTSYASASTAHHPPRKREREKERSREIERIRDGGGQNWGSRVTGKISTEDATQPKKMLIMIHD